MRSASPPPLTPAGPRGSERALDVDSWLPCALARVSLGLGSLCVRLVLSRLGWRGALCVAVPVPS